jgi:uncharacterized protein YecE (DUF72 family)
MSRIFIGTSGWSYSHWYEVFYPSGLPRGEMLSFYAKEFRTVEVNSSFYRIPFEGMIKGWWARSPSDFRFAIKVLRRITHLNKLVDCQAILSGFLARIEGLQEKLGVLLYQLPPSLKKDLPRLSDFIKLLPSKWRHAIEFRHDSWIDDETFNVLKEANIGYCIISAPKLKQHIEVTANFVYIRMHGRSQWYRYEYSEDEILWWAERINEFKDKGLDVYCYFNNDVNGYAVKNARQLLANLKED